jgi:hypothetical protein
MQYESKPLLAASRFLEFPQEEPIIVPRSVAMHCITHVVPVYCTNTVRFNANSHHRVVEHMPIIA